MIRALTRHLTRAAHWIADKVDRRVCGWANLTDEGDEQ